MKAPGWKSALLFNLVLVIFAKGSFSYQEKRIQRRSAQVKAEIARSLAQSHRAPASVQESEKSPVTQSAAPSKVEESGHLEGVAAALTQAVALPKEELPITDRSYCPNLAQAAATPGPDGLCEYNAACLICPDSRVIPTTGSEAKCADSDDPPVLNDIVCCAPKLMNGGFGACPAIDLCRDQDMRSVCSAKALGNGY